jgi:molybdopterin converting factor small subunit
MMKIQVKYSAQLRTALQRAEEDLELPPDSRLSELLLQLAERHVAGRPHLLNAKGTFQASLLIVVNESAVAANDAAGWQLKEGDVVLLLPPIAGG